MADIPAQKPDKVEGACGESGGTFFPKTGKNSTYGCINSDGSGIVCGGITKRDKATCSTFLQAPSGQPQAATALPDRKSIKSEKLNGLKHGEKMNEVKPD